MNAFCMSGLKSVLYMKTLKTLQSTKPEVLYLSIAAIFKNLQEAWRPFRTADTKGNVLPKKYLCSVHFHIRAYLYIN